MNCVDTNTNWYTHLFYIILIFIIIISNSRNVFAQTNLLSSPQDSTLQKPLYGVNKAPVHQWIAYQAYLKLDDVDDGPLKTEIGQYIPHSIPNDVDSFYSGDKQPGNQFNIPDDWDDPGNDDPAGSSEALIEGTWEEDQGNYGSLFSFRWLHHFWNPDGGYNDGLFEQQSALLTAQEHFAEAVRQYKLGENYKAKAYYWLGRTTHLLEDMTVPAHVQNDPHVAPDNYEDFIGTWEFHYQQITATSPNPASVQSATYTDYTPSWFNDDLTNLFYELANYTDKFDSDDKDGDSDEFGKGKYRTASIKIDDQKIFWKATIPATGITLISPTDLFVVNSAWSNDACIVFTSTGLDKFGGLNLPVNIYYTDGTIEYLQWIDRDDVPWAVISKIFQPRLQGNAIEYVASLYQLFWDTVNPIIKPSVTTDAPSLLGTTNARLNGNVTSDGGGTILQRGFYWSTSDTSPDEDDNIENVSGTIGSYYKDISNLSPCENYYVRAFATNEAGTTLGSAESFTISISYACSPNGAIIYNTSTGKFNFCEGGVWVEKRGAEEYVYKTVTIGNQVWMAENLKVTHYRNGDPIPNVTGDAWSGTTPMGTGAYCSYDDDDNNIDTYGLLYNGYAIQDCRGLAPEGWHVPSDQEWKQLEIYLGMSLAEVNSPGHRGDKGPKLKSTSGWYREGNGTNESGFSALPGGARGSSFRSLLHDAIFWTSSVSSTGNECCLQGRVLVYDADWIHRSNYGKGAGYSIRCIKD